MSDGGGLGEGEPPENDSVVLRGRETIFWFISMASSQWLPDWSDF